MRSRMEALLLLLYHTPVVNFVVCSQIYIGLLSDLIPFMLRRVSLLCASWELAVNTHSDGLH